MMLRRGINAGFAVVALCLLITGLYSYRAIRVLYSDSKHIAAERETSRRARTLLLILSDAETGQRGYLLTGNKTYLDIYHKSLEEIPQALMLLTEWTAPSPPQSARVKQLAELIPVKLKELEDTIKLLQNHQEDEAQALLNSNLGKMKMDEMRRIIAQIDQAAVQNLEISEQSLDSSRSRLTAGLLLALAVALLLLAMGYTVTHRLTRAQETANLTLEARVQERTHELLVANVNLQNEITERRKAEELLQKSNVELNRSNRELEDFAYVASHDLQEPLRKIQAFGDRLVSKHAAALPPEAQDYLSRMSNAAHRMESLIHDLLAYSRINTQGKPFQDTDLQEIAQGVMSDLEDLLARTGGAVTLPELPHIEADPLQMRQLLQNLLANALKFYRAGVPPQVIVTSQIEDGPVPHLRLAFADNGIGFEEKYLDRIFQPFQRLHARQVYEGTGMGLAVCRKIVERHNGTITARSQPDSGTTFIVTLPLTHNQGDTTDA